MATVSFRAQLIIVTIIALVVATALQLAELAGFFLTPGLDSNLANKDFANYWIGSMMALDGRANEIFAPWETYFANMKAVFGEDYPWHNWSYPPNYLLMVLPLGLLPYKVAALVFLATSSCLLVAALLTYRDRIPIWLWVLLLPAIIHNFIAIQNGFLTAALIILALGLRDTKPILAGFFLGLLTIKPQLGLLFPLFLLIEKNWSMILSAGVTTIGLALAASLAFGFEAWLGYFEHIMPYQTSVMTEFSGLFLFGMPSVFGWVRSLQFSADTAFIFHAVIAVPAFILTYWAIWKEQNSMRRAALLVFGTFTIVPYSLSYDLLPVSLMAAALIWENIQKGNDRLSGINLVLLLACLVPVFILQVTMMGIPMAQITYIMCLAWLIFEALNKAEARMNLKASSHAGA